MRDLTPETITQVFRGYFDDASDPRAREVLGALAQHLHAFVLETRLTHDEWRKGLELLGWAGRITTPERNEFVLFSDVLGVSSLVDMIHSTPAGTSSSVLGPFHVTGAPALANGGDLKGQFAGEVVLVRGQVRDASGRPVPRAAVNIWQTAPNGLYSSQDPDQDTYSFHGLLTADDDGHYAFTTVRPVPYQVPTDGPAGELLRASGRHAWRPSHLHFIVTADGFRTLVTEVFPDDDPYLDEDTVFGVRRDLVMRYVPQPAGSFPGGLALSGQVDGGYSSVDFDLILTAE
ncbi:dioxygenase [Sphingomonas sp.]|jgi:protocatechuate 3,4-dioxygenase beta subunit|uniref:dioxygenase family protein n=1 Tax=Sphingomonas sp. TaxID=28214 RepID=UPI002ED88F79